ncbi:hypothetical protein E2C01_089818 [Portunus trituberculatus]|uniref:Uncharacterized protein n=1 Tax=Portunus trituberculatus TaxID=210409 RepID=A0A5B7JD26_PORTR|nr:hypothetical protein [Portunus trituberculatus]
MFSSDFDFNIVSHKGERQQFTGGQRDKTHLNESVPETPHTISSHCTLTKDPIRRCHSQDLFRKQTSRTRLAARPGGATPTIYL